MKKFYHIVIFSIIFLMFANIINICAETASPESMDLPEPTASPTPVNNVIHSMGDFKLFAQYSDKRVVDENLSINTKNFDINSISSQIIQAVRAQDGEKDIFLYFNLSLKMNGRDITQNSSIDITIDVKEVFVKYQNISLFKVSDKGVLKLSHEEKDGKVNFSTNELGYFLVTGVINPEFFDNSTASPNTNTPTLQEGVTAGIMFSDNHQSNNKSTGQITPGAFVFWIIAALVIGLWLGLGIGYILWGRYKTKKVQRGPYVIGE